VSEHTDQHAERDDPEMERSVEQPPEQHDSASDSELWTTTRERSDHVERLF
jgi:hypothetical protein